MEYEVSLDILSGLPNPTWLLKGDLADAFERRIAGLPKATQNQPVEPPGLGYRGIRVRSVGGPPDQGSKWYVLRGAVSTASAVREDPGRGLERWLLDTGKPHVSVPVWEAASREVPE